MTWTRGALILLVGSLFLFLLFMLGGACLESFTEDHMKQQLRTSLQEITACFHRYQVDYWLDFGTALGQFRDQDIIQGDLDIDLGLHEQQEQDFLSLIVPCLDTNYSMVRGDNVYRLYLRRDVNINCDVYIYRENPARQLVYSKIVADYDTIFPTRDVHFSTTHPFPVRTMAQSHNAMVLRYGQDYRIPRRNDKGVDSDPTLAQTIPPWIHRRVITWRNALHLHRQKRKDITPSPA
jgi:hypothetical protein